MRSQLQILATLGLALAKQSSQDCNDGTRIPSVQGTVPGVVNIPDIPVVVNNKVALSPSINSVTPAATEEASFLSKIPGIAGGLVTLGKNKLIAEFDDAVSFFDDIMTPDSVVPTASVGNQILLASLTPTFVAPSFVGTVHEAVPTAVYPSFTDEVSIPVESHFSLAHRQLLVKLDTTTTQAEATMALLSPAATMALETPITQYTDNNPPAAAEEPTIVYVDEPIYVTVSSTDDASSTLTPSSPQVLYVDEPASMTATGDASTVQEDNSTTDSTDETTDVDTPTATEPETDLSESDDSVLESPLPVAVSEVVTNMKIPSEVTIAAIPECEETLLMTPWNGTLLPAPMQYNNTRCYQSIGANHTASVSSIRSVMTSTKYTPVTSTARSAPTTTQKSQTTLVVSKGSAGQITQSSAFQFIAVVVALACSLAL